MEIKKTVLPHGIGSVEILDIYGNDLTIVNSARVSYAKESTELNEKDIKLIKYLADNEHMTPFEQVNIRLRFKMPKFIWCQFVRHRTQSMNEVSGRYIELPDEAYIPQELRKQAESSKQASIEAEWEESDKEEITRIYENTYKLAYQAYRRVLEKGLCKEQARALIPFGFYTTFITNINLRNLIHWYKLRIDNHAQWEHQEFAKATIELLKDTDIKYSIEALIKNK